MTSRLIAGAGTEGMNEGWGQPDTPIGPTVAERIDQLAQQVAQMHDENVQLQDELNNLQ